MVVVGGFSYSFILCFKEMYFYFFLEVIKNWNEMIELVFFNGNYCNYCKVFVDCDGFKIFIFGVYLKDLIVVYVIFLDWMEENKVNIVKMYQFFVILSELVFLQNVFYYLEFNMDLINLFMFFFDFYYIEDDIYKLLLVLEFRNFKLQFIFFIIFNKFVVFFEWVLGVMLKLDFMVINKYIRKLVEFVFRNYDYDYDGYIF